MNELKFSESVKEVRVPLNGATLTQNVAAEGLALLLHTLEVPGSRLDFIPAILSTDGDGGGVSETSVKFYETVRCNIPEDSHLHRLGA